MSRMRITGSKKPEYDDLDARTIELTTAERAHALSSGRDKWMPRYSVGVEAPR